MDDFPAFTADDHKRFIAKMDAKRTEEKSFGGQDVTRVLREGDYDAFAKLYTKAIADKPNDPRLYNHIEINLNCASMSNGLNEGDFPFENLRPMFAIIANDEILAQAFLSYSVNNHLCPIFKKN